MAQYGTVCNMSSPPNWRISYVSKNTINSHITFRPQTCQSIHHYTFSMTSHCAWSWDNRTNSGVRQWHNMAQYVICVLSTSPLSISYVTHDTTMAFMLSCHLWHTESMTPSWQQWHHTVLELGKDDSGVKQWHNMAQYVIYVLAT